VLSSSGPASSQSVGNYQNKTVTIDLRTVSTTQPGLHPKVSGAPVVIRVGSKAAAEQVKSLPTMVPITAIVDPKVVSVQSLAGGKQTTTSGQANGLKTIASPTSAASVTHIAIAPKPAPNTITTGVATQVPVAVHGVTIAAPQVSMTTPGIRPQVSMTTPQISTATAAEPGSGASVHVKPKYLPLESLKEVNRQATLNTVSPVSAVIDDTTKPSPVEQQTLTVISPAPMDHQDVTVNNRYRYIAPTGQPVPQAAQTSSNTPTNSTNAGSSPCSSTHQYIVLQQVSRDSGLWLKCFPSVYYSLECKVYSSI